MFNDTNPEYWYEIAKHDSETAEILIKENGYPDIIIYHLHQSVEKMLKGKILEYTNEFPFIHDLERLFKILVKQDTKYGQMEDSIIKLNSYSGSLRYPQSDFLNIEDLENAKQYYKKIISSLVK
jgi:HEPN domain-containing protein